MMASFSDDATPEVERDIDKLALSLGQLPRCSFRVRPDTDEIQQALHFRHFGHARKSLETGRASSQGSGRDQHVFHHSLIEEELRNLEGAGNA
jgi:hypothetical protein